jgi:DNA-binding transcriptional LysR family regulator
MELRHIRCFQAVAEELNFRRAAERLGMSQPPVTIAIQQLETEVGTKLFTRSNRSVRLSPAGAAFGRKISEAMGNLEDAQRVARQVGRGQIDRIKIGFLVPTAWGILPPALSRFRLCFPEVEVRLQPQDFRTQADESVQRTCDVYLGAYFSPDKLFASKRLHRGKLLALIPPQHPLAVEGPISVRELANETILIPSKAYFPNVRSEVIDFCRNKGGFQPKVMENLDPPSMALLALSGFGIGFFLEMPKSGLLGSFCLRPFKEGGPQIQSGLAWRRDLESPVLEYLINEIRCAAQDGKGSSNKKVISFPKVGRAKTQ